MPFEENIVKAVCEKGKFFRQEPVRTPSCPDRSSPLWSNVKKGDCFFSVTVHFVPRPIVTSE
jgi:hypothetical protein